MTKKNITMFSAWLIIATICVAAIILGINSRMCSAIILSTFLLLPMRNWLIIFVNWLLTVLVANDDHIWKFLRQFIALGNPMDPNDKTFTRNEGFYKALNASIGAVCAFIALIFWVFQGFSNNIVYCFIHNMYIIVSNLFGNGGQRISVFIWLILCIVELAIIIWFFSLFFRGIWGADSNGYADPAAAKRDVLIFSTSFVLGRIKNYILLQYNIEMIVANIGFWLVVFILPVIIIIFVLPIVWSWIRRIFR